MRTYGRITNAEGNLQWVEVTTDANGRNDNVWLTTLAQNLKLNIGESPFYANNGIPQYQTIVTQVFPDFYVMQIQSQFSQYFPSLIITKNQTPAPNYNVRVMTSYGVVLPITIPV